MEEFTHPTLDKILSLKAQLTTNAAYEEDVQKVTSWEADIRDLVARETMATSEIIKTMVVRYQEEMTSFLGQLQTHDSTQLPDSQRDRLLDRIKLYRSFIEQFDLKTIRVRIESVDKTVQEELDSLQ